MSHQGFVLIHEILFGVFLVYEWASIIVTLARVYFNARIKRVFNAVWRWTKYPSLLALIIMPVVHIFAYGNNDTWDNIGYLVNLGVWWLYRDAGDDDPWDKVKKKLKEKIENVKGKLVVVPESA